MTNAAPPQLQPSIELADWLLSEQARFASSICCNDPAVKMHIAWLKSGEQEVRSHASLKADNEQLRKALGALNARVVALEQVISEEMYPENCSDDANRMLLESAIDSHNRRIRTVARAEK
jgi:hypothetical protein